MKRICKLVFLTLLLMALALPAALAWDAAATNEPLPAQVQPLNEWLFRKGKPGENNKALFRTDSKPVTLPHSCNSEDALTDSIWRGVTEYVYHLKAEENRYYVLRIDGAAQRSEVFVNNVLVGGSRAGYSPYAVDLSGALMSGVNNVAVYCDSRVDLTQIPISGDFNLCNGMHGGAVLYTFGNVYIDPSANGLDRMRVKQDDVSAKSATLTVSLLARNRGGKPVKDASLRVTLLDAEGAAVAEETLPFELAKDETPVTHTFTVKKPHLWHGTQDPYLHTVKAELMVGDTCVDSTETRVGIHSFHATSDGGFYLNGKSYPLRGAGMHQDHPDGALAMSDEAIDESLAIAMEMGCNFLRLSHYPHREYTLRRCDELGLVVAEEIPWVNHCGVNAEDAYFDTICQSMDAMILNGRNHASVHFWGMSNEIGNTHYKNPDGASVDPQGGTDWAKAHQWNDELYQRAKELDDVRLIGFAAYDGQAYNAAEEDRLDQWAEDYLSYNMYQGWYGGQTYFFGGRIDSFHTTLPDRLIALSEYGAGANPDTHSLTPHVTTNTGTGGERHDEEYQNLFHESYLEQIQERPYLLFTSVWTLFDFAVNGRNEGNMPYLNDKGLVSRDRQLRKDSFYLYKAAWREDIPVVYITSRRFSPRTPGKCEIKAYANTDTLSLYVDGELMQKLDSPTSGGVIWQFDPLLMPTGDHIILVSGSRNGETAEDGVIWQMDGTLSDLKGIVIFEQPTSLIATQGSVEGSLEVLADSMDKAPLTYQWYYSASGDMKDSEPLEGAVDAAFPVPADLKAGTYYYSCEISAKGRESVSTDVVSVTVFPSTFDDRLVIDYLLSGEVGDRTPSRVLDIMGSRNMLYLEKEVVYGEYGVLMNGEGDSASTTASTSGEILRVHIEFRTPSGINIRNRIAVLPGGDGIALMYVPHGPIDNKNFTLKAESTQAETYFDGETGMFSKTVGYEEMYRTVCDIQVAREAVRVTLHCELLDGTTGGGTFEFLCPNALDILLDGGVMALNRPDGLRPIGEEAELERLCIYAIR